MPIRTNRGRAAVYRRLWGWPLRSPRHLIVAFVGVVIVAVAVAVVAARAGSIGGHGQASPGGNGTGSVTITSEVPSPASALGGGATTGSVAITTLASPPTPMSAPAAPAALSVIDTWGKAWVNHPAGMTNAQWLNQLRPYTTPEFLPVMSSVDVANIDATEVTGPPKATKSYVSSVEALLPTNAGQLDITAVATPQGWQVSSYTEAS